MALTYAGYDGTVTEAQWALLMTQAAVEYAVGSAADLLVTAAARVCSVAAGSAFGKGVLVTNSAAIGGNTVPTPAAGQWFLVCLRRDWSANSASIVILAQATGADAAVVGPPASLPAKGTVGGTAFTGNPGVLDDQPLAWVWARASTTTMQVFDLRTLSNESRLAGVERHGSDVAVYTGSASTPTGAGTQTQMLLTAKVTSPAFQLSGNAMQCVKAGTYEVMATIESPAPASASNVHYGYVRKNGTPISPGGASSQGYVSTATANQISLYLIVDLAAGDLLDLAAGQNTGATLTQTGVITARRLA